MQLSQAEKATTRNQRLKLALKATITLVLIGVAFSAVEPSAVKEVTSGVSWGWIGAAGLVVVAIILLEAFQFRAVAHALGHVISPGTSVRIAFVGRFFSLFTPAMVGNDVYRAAAMHSIGFGAGSAVSTVLVSRLVSLVALVPVLLAGLPVVFKITGGGPETAIVALVSMVPVAAVAAIYAMALFGQRITGMTSRPLVRQAFTLASGVDEALFKSHTRGQIWISAILQHLLRVVSLATLGRAYGVEQGTDVFFAFVPVALLIAMVPISFGSWGVRELSLVYSLGLAGVPAAKALAVSVSFGLVGLLLGLAGGAFWLFKPGQTRRFPSRSEMEKSRSKDDHTP